MLVETLERGAINRAQRTWTEPAGKGVNIARALAANGVETQAIIPSGGANGQELGRLLAASGVDFVAVPISGEVRSNVTVTEPDGTVTKLNEAGPEMSADETRLLIEAAGAASSEGDWVAASGSLAPGMPADFYALLARRLEAIGARLAVDTSGLPLRAALEGRPGVVKPNRHELAELLGHPIVSLGDAANAGREVLELGAGRVLISLGPDGALLVSPGGVSHGELQVATIANTVGAGDALLAGFLAAGAEGVEGLAGALAWSSAAIRSPQTSMAPLSQADWDAVSIRESIDEQRILEDDEASSVGPTHTGQPA